MPLFLYRTQDSDSDGDPIDFGLVRGKTDKDAVQFVGQHLVDILGEETEPMEFNLYEVIDSEKNGVIDSKARTVHRHAAKERKAKR